MGNDFKTVNLVLSFKFQNVRHEVNNISKI